jgi:hypothetical protein
MPVGQRQIAGLEGPDFGKQVATWHAEIISLLGVDRKGAGLF